MNGKSIMCESYSCLYHHEFSRNSEEHCIITPEDLKNCREKLIHKFKKMVELSAEEMNPVFIRYIHSSSYPKNNDAFIYTEKTIVEISNAISNAIGHDRFKLLFVTVEKTEFQDRLLQPCQLIESGKVNCITYSGDYTETDIDAFWGKIFTSYTMD